MDGGSDSLVSISDAVDDRSGVASGVGGAPAVEEERAGDISTSLAAAEDGINTAVGRDGGT